MATKKEQPPSPEQIAFIFDPDARPLDWARCAESYLDMITHTRAHDGGIMKLLGLQRPGESPESKVFGMNNIEAVTKGAITNAKADIFGAISSAEYAVYHDNPVIQEYLFSRKYSDVMAPGGGYTYDKWVINVAAKERMTDDANGFMTWLPVGTPGSAGERLVVEPYLIYRIYVTYFNRDRITFYRPENKFYLSDGKLGKEFWTITKEAFWKHTQIEDTEKKGIEVYSHELVYQHNTGSLLINILGGISDVSLSPYKWKDRATFGADSLWNPNRITRDGTAWNGFNYDLPVTINYFESFFSGFTPFANEAIKCFSDWQKSRVKTAHPVVVRQGNECPNTECKGGFVQGGEAEKYALKFCPTCGGPGQNLLTNPLGDVVIPPVKTSDVEGKLQNLPDPYKFVIPPTESLKAMEDSFWNLLKEAKENIFQKFNEAAQADVAKRRDREGKYNFVASISEHIFGNLIPNHTWSLIQLLLLNNPEPVSIVAPVDFELKSESELLDDLKALRDSDAPDAVIRQAESKLMKRTFLGDEYAADIIRVMGVFDDLYGVPAADIEGYKALGAVDNTAIQRHILAYQVVQNITMKQGESWLSETDPEKIRAIMETEFQLIKPTEAPPINILPGNAGG